MARSKIRICREGWWYILVMAFVLVGAIARQMNLLMILFGMMVGPLLFSWRWSATTLRKIDVKRRLPGPVAAGELLVIEMELTNRRRALPGWAIVARDQIGLISPKIATSTGRPSANGNGAGAMEQNGRLEDSATKPGERIEAEVLFAHLPPRESRRGAYRGHIPARGRYKIGPVTLSTRFPLGLIERRVIVSAHDEFIVYPAIGKLMPQWDRAQQPNELGAKKARQRQGLVQGPFYGLREWRTGDNQRWIHWRTSARRNSLIVRQFEQQRNQDVTVIVDLWAPKNAGEEHFALVERAISFAASIVTDVCHHGGVELVMSIAAAASSIHSAPASPGMLHEVMEKLAVAEATCDDALPSAVRAAIERTNAWTNIVLISTRRVDLSRTEFHEAQNGRRDVPLEAIQVFNVGDTSLADVFQMA